MASYSNLRAMRALVTASLQSIVKSPSAVVFSLAFPLVFILVFGFLGGGHSVSIPVAPAPGADMTNPVMQELIRNPALKWRMPTENRGIDELLNEGEIVAAIAIREQPPGQVPRHLVSVKTTSAQIDQLQQLRSVINEVVQRQDPVISQRVAAMAKLDVTIAKVREFKMIDFILPGQLGFSLLASGVFGTAFVFFNMRQTLVLKRFFATPVKRGVIVFSEGLARLLFQIAGAVIIIAMGHYVFDFTLVEGWLTFLNMILLCALGMMVFMGFGFVVSSIAKSESTIPPLANIITMPQFLLAGTFFPVDEFPSWLQPLCRILPLTYLNDALRKIAFDGFSLLQVKLDLLVLLVWGAVVYFVAARLFKWE